MLAIWRLLVRGHRLYQLGPLRLFAVDGNRPGLITALCSMWITALVGTGTLSSIRGHNTAKSSAVFAATTSHEGSCSEHLWRLTTGSHPSGGFESRFQSLPLTRGKNGSFSMSLAVPSALSSSLAKTATTEPNRNLNEDFSQAAPAVSLWEQPVPWKGTAGKQSNLAGPAVSWWEQPVTWKRHSRQKSNLAGPASPGDPASANRVDQPTWCYPLPLLRGS